MQYSRQLATFSLGGFCFGVDVLDVQEVLRFQAMTPVPLAAREVEGLMNLRGRIVTAIDLRRRLSLEARNDGELPMNVVVRQEAEVVSFLVDEIGDVIEVSETRFEAPPATLAAELRDIVTGVYKLDDRLLLLLDIERASEVE